RTFDDGDPQPVITSSASAVTNASPIPFTVTFNEAVTGFVVGDLTIGNGTAGSFAGSGTTYTLDVTPSGEGAVTIDVAAGVAIDGVSNPNAAAVQYSRTYDSVQPTVAVTTSAGEPTSVSPIPVTVTFSEAVTGFASGDVTLGNGSISNFSGSG